jgi:hypothetical protein
MVYIYPFRTCLGRFHYCAIKVVRFEEVANIEWRFLPRVMRTLHMETKLSYRRKVDRHDTGLLTHLSPGRGLDAFAGLDGTAWRSPGTGS